MECKLSKINSELEKQLEEEKRQIEYWRNLQIEQRKEHEKWCEKTHNTILELLGWEYKAQDTAEGDFFYLFDEFKKLTEGKINRGINCRENACHRRHCKRLISDLWDYCPFCGERLKEIDNVKHTNPMRREG